MIQLKGNLMIERRKVRAGMQKPGTEDRAPVFQASEAGCIEELISTRMTNITQPFSDCCKRMTAACTLLDKVLGEW